MKQAPNTPRAERRQRAAIERRAHVTGDWGEWEAYDTAPGAALAFGGRAWTLEITKACRNRRFAVLVRPLKQKPPFPVCHFAITSISEIEPTWAELQRIKNELAGPHYSAVQVYPSTERLVDEANMYHLWLFAPGHEFGFGIAAGDEPADAPRQAVRA